MGPGAARRHGAGDERNPLARWAIRNLAVEGPRPAFRVGEQPYGLLPTSAFKGWVDEPGDPLAAIEARIRRGHSAGARAPRPRRAPRADESAGADTRGLLDVLGLHAPSRHWQRAARWPIAINCRRLRAMFGLPPLDTTWDDNRRALRDMPSPLAPIGRAPGEGPIPGPPLDESGRHRATAQPARDGAGTAASARPFRSSAWSAT